jgi:hypothetical protein
MCSNVVRFISEPYCIIEKNGTKVLALVQSILHYTPPNYKQRSLNAIYIVLIFPIVAYEIIQAQFVGTLCRLDSKIIICTNLDIIGTSREIWLEYLSLFPGKENCLDPQTQPKKKKDMFLMGQVCNSLVVYNTFLKLFAIVLPPSN